jgi:hypothetical protein
LAQKLAGSRPSIGGPAIGIVAPWPQEHMSGSFYVASRGARVLDRKTLQPLDSFGSPGELYVMHHMNVDAKGNLHVTEVQDGKRIQKFTFKGLTSR